LEKKLSINSLEHLIIGIFSSKSYYKYEFFKFKLDIRVIIIILTEEYLWDIVLQKGTDAKKPSIYAKTKD